MFFDFFTKCEIRLKFVVLSIALARPCTTIFVVVREITRTKKA